ncbi:MAG TPA: ATP-binding protein [Vicinamibacterales bacterium]|jgi:PAS domain S-box-containing protein
MRSRLTGTTVGLALGITVAVSSVLAVAAYFYSTHHFESLLQTARQMGIAQGELIRAALEHQMIENDRTLIARMIQSFGGQPSVERVVLLDRTGHVRYSSVPLDQTGDLQIGSPTCQACHRYPPEQRGSSRVLEASGGTVLRTVVPFRNREACHRCHDPARRVNGILILDRNVGDVRASINRDLVWMVGGTGLATLALVGAIAAIIRFVILRRLQRFETTARQIASGDLGRRVPAEGSDTISWLAREFNAMADSVTGLVGEVRNQRERLETVINSIDDGIVVLDSTRTVMAANDAFLARTGGRREALLGCCCQDAAGGACNVEQCPTSACLQSGRRQVRLCERTTADGSVRWEEIHASPIADADGRIAHVVEVWRDISDRRATEASLAESHKLASLGLLASGFSHELNTPLATVLMCVEGILRDVRSSEADDAGQRRIGESAAIAREQVLRCRGITQHFLRMARGQSSPGDIVDLEGVVSAAARLVEPTARASGVTITVEAQVHGLRVRADEAALQHAIINLLLNAVQACKGGGSVTIGTEGGDPVRIRVRDDGCGIPSEHLKQIFEPFCSMRKGGTGLGLFLSLNFIRASGGDITVSSAVGSGSTFEVTLPALGGMATGERSL